MAGTPGPDRIVLEVAKLSLSAARRCVSTYGSIKSRHDFTQPQLIACLVLRAYLRTTFRGITQLLAEMPDVRAALGLERVPHFTTLQKLHEKPHVLGVIEAMLTDLLRGVTGQECARVEEVAMDSTGLAMTNASVYFRMVKERDKPKKPSERVAKRPAKNKRGATRRTGRYVKVSVAVACALFMPCAMRVAFGPRADTTETPVLLEQTFRVLRPARLYADAGFDAESLHETCRDGHGTESWVPPVIKTNDGSIRTPHRASMLPLPECYGRRWLVESFFSALKRTTGGSLNCRQPRALLCEAAMRVLAYTVHR
jgi:hypothetical protein